MARRRLRDLCFAISVLVGMWLARSAWAVSECGYPPSGTCYRYTCSNGSWEVTGYASAGTTCDDHSLCTTGNVCDGSGHCGTPLAGIDDNNPCTTDSCNASTGVITHTPKVDGTPCPDGNLCNGQETCKGGVCTSGTPPTVDDGNPCTADSCDPATGVITHTQAVSSAGCSSGTYFCHDKYGNVTRKVVCVAGVTCDTSCP